MKLWQNQKYTETGGWLKATTTRVSGTSWQKISGK
jgi:hypothetical protein